MMRETLAASNDHRDHARELLPAEEKFLISCGLHTQSILAGQLFRNHAPHFVHPCPARAFISEGALKETLLSYHQHLLSFLLLYLLLFLFVPM